MTLIPNLQDCYKCKHRILDGEETFQREVVLDSGGSPSQLSRSLCSEPLKNNVSLNLSNYGGFHLLSHKPFVSVCPWILLISICDRFGLSKFLRQFLLPVQLAFETRVFIATAANQVNFWKKRILGDGFFELIRLYKFCRLWGFIFAMIGRIGSCLPSISHSSNNITCGQHCQTKVCEFYLKFF